MTLLTEVLRSAHGLSHAAHLVLLAITAYIDEHGAPAYPSQATLAKDSGVSERYIEACVQESEGAGYLDVERRRTPGKRARNFYTVVCPWRTIPEQVSGNLVPRTQFPEQVSPKPDPRTEIPEKTPSLEKKEKKDLQENRDRGNQFPEPGSPNQVHPLPTAIELHPRALNTLNWLGYKLGSDAYARLTGGVPPSEHHRGDNIPEDIPPSTMEPEPLAPLPTDPPPTPCPRAPRNPAAYRLGKLCPRGHAHEGTGLSLRRMPGGSCVACETLRRRERDLTKNPTPRAHKPYVWKTPMESERIIYQPGDAPQRHREYRPNTERRAKARNGVAVMPDALN